jgi:hypothetical protein
MLLLKHLLVTQVQFDQGSVGDVLLSGNGLFQELLYSLAHVDQLLLHTGVPVVLNRVVRSSFEYFGDFSPFVTAASVHEVEDPFFLLAPADFFDLGVEVVVPSLSALLPNSAWQVLGYQGPLLGAVLFD